MAASTNHWKLGLFVIVGLFFAAGTLVWLGAASFDKEVTYYVTYFDESVQGLDVGSPVKFRGVTIGNVSNIEIAEDRRHVEVEAIVNTKVLASLGMNPKTRKIPSELRAQLTSAGITGLKFIQVDFVDTEKHPLPELPFKTPRNYIPAAPSMLKSLEDAVVKSVGRFPETTREAIALLKKLNVLLADVNSKGFPTRAVETMDKVNGTIDQARSLLVLTQKKIRRFDVAALNENLYLATENVVDLTAKADLAMDGINGGLARINRILARVERRGGMLENVEDIVRVLRAEARQLEGTMATVKATITSVKGTADTINGVARDANGLTGQVGGTLRAIKETAESIRRVADALEVDPDMLVKGRSVQ